jgi:circadian clock protein KaiC
MVTASVLAKSSTDYKKFINELQTWVGVIGSTVLFLTSAGPDARFEPEYTMVDGIFELGARRLGMRWHRQLSVLKFRGSGFAEGAHPYVITNDGLVVYPRVEAQLGRTVLERTGRERIGSGVARLDELVGGGLARGSTTLLLGSSGGGKTTLGLHFLAEGAARGEPGLHFGFYENPSDLVRKADRLGLGFGPHVEAGRIRLVWQPPAERILDALAYQMLDAVRAHGAKRLVIDGLVGFKEAFYPERLPGYFSVLTGELGALGVTTLITEETRELFVQAVDAPAVSAIFDNVLLLRQLETGGELVRILSILKTRDSGHDRRLYKIDVTDGGLVVGARLAPGVGPAPPDLPRGSGGGGPGH